MQAVTVKVDENTAKQLTEMKYIKMGFVQGRVEERVSVLKCFKSWGSVHKAVDCKG